MRKIIFFISALLLTACASDNNCAPVVNAWEDPQVMKSRYRVQKDDTIYSVAWNFDLDYRDLAKANHLSPPYNLKEGQTLTMQVTKHSKTSEPTKETLNTNSFALDTSSPDTHPKYREILLKSQPQHIALEPLSSDRKVNLGATINKNQNPDETLVISKRDEITKENINLPEWTSKRDLQDKNEQLTAQTKPKTNLVSLPGKTAVINQDKIVAQLNSSHWQWPLRGKILREFSLTTGGSKGVDIAGNLGDPVKAVAPGKVVYSGGGLKGYGNLIIIKHSDNYLTAYAYNKKLLVKEGDMVKAGSEIGKVGQNNAGQTLLHFEVRRNGKPVNPLLYL